MSRFAGLATDDLDTAIGHAAPALERMRGGRILITGGTGFFGRWLLAVLARAWPAYAVEAVVLSRDPAGFATREPELASHPAVTLVAGDVRSFNFPHGRFTHLIHAATDTSAAADADPATLIDSIVGGTARVLDFARAAGIGRLLYVSSGAVYGPQPAALERLPEDHPGAPDPLDRRSAYGQAKRLAEQMCICAGGSGFEPVIARAFAFVGPGLPLDGHFAIGNFIADAAAGRPITIKGDGTPVRSYLYAGDLAAWLLMLLALGEAGQAYNVGSDEGLGLATVAEAVAAAAPTSVPVRILGAANPGAPRNRYVPATDRARALGLSAWTPLSVAIARTIEHARLGPSPEASREAPRNEHAPSAGRALTFVIDVDGVVAGLVHDNDYRKAEPLTDTIAAINALHAKGHRIIMLTARGSATGIDWRAVTEEQFARWGLSYDALHFGKPAADYYVDDRLLSISALQALAARA